MQLYQCRGKGGGNPTLTRSGRRQHASRQKCNQRERLLLMDDDGPSNALEAFKALHHPERKAAEKLLLTNGLREAEKRKMRQYGHLVNESVGFMAVPFGSTVPRVAKLLKDMAKRQKQVEVWDSLGRTTNLNPMATCLQFSYANLSLLFARFHAKIIPWGHDS